jgi:hypothetical protein
MSLAFLDPWIVEMVQAMSMTKGATPDRATGR